MNSELKVLITGGCGFIGVNLIEKLIEKKVSFVKIIDDFSVGKPEDLESVFHEIGDFDLTVSGDVRHYSFADSDFKCEVVRGSILNKNDLKSVMDGMTSVVHLAANTGVLPSIENPLMDCEVNVIGTVNVLEAMRESGVNKMVFASSGAPLGEQTPPIDENKVPMPLSPYGASKLAGEGYCSAYNGSFGINTVVLRFGNVYGPRSYHKDSVVAKFFKRALDGKTLEIFGEGTQTRDFIYVKDLVEAVYSALTKDVGGEIFQIATYKETSVNEITEMIKSIVERETGKTVKIINTAPNKGEIERNFSDISKAQKILGFDPKYDVQSGLEECFQWFKDKLS